MSQPKIVEPDDRTDGHIKCFYCHEPVGTPHKADCVCNTRKIKVRVTVEYEIDAPPFYDSKESTEFYLNECTRCKSHIIEELQALVPEDVFNQDYENPAPHQCLCGIAHYEYLGEVEDEG